MKYYKKIKKCRVCESENLIPVLKLSDQYIGTTFVEDNSKHPMSKVKIPLTLMFCDKCKLVQLEETVNPELLYKNYYYRTNVNDTMRNDLLELVENTMSKTFLRFGDCVVDIGANDMTMIQMFPSFLNRVGVEPAKNIDWNKVDKSIQIVNDYFSKESVIKYIKSKNKKAKIITCCACFYDMDDPNKVTRDIKGLLDEEGVCTIQVSHLLATVKDMNFYDVVHEHLEYYSLESINNLMERNGLSIFDVTTNFVNGGSLRIYVTHKERNIPKKENFYKILEEEKNYHLNEHNIYIHYGERINEVAQKSKSFILSEIEKGNLVLGLGASTKGNVLLQVCGIGRDILPYISERNPEKYGLRTLGTDIELISEEVAHHLNPSVMVVLPWNFKKEIIKREQEYIQNGGKLMFIMPYPYYVDVEGEHRI